MKNRLPEATGFAFFVGLLLWNLWHHRMWGDEIQAWLICCASSNPAELIQNLEFEGHPALWYLILWPFSLLTSNPVVLKWVQATVVSLGLGLLWLCSPFSRVEKFLLSWSYCLVFNYAVVCRSYCLAVTLLFLFLAFRERIDRFPPAGWVLLGLLLNVHFLVAIFAVALAVLWLGSDRDLLKARLNGISIFVLLGAFACWTVLSMSNITGPTHPWYIRFSVTAFARRLSTFAYTFLPAINLDLNNYWEHSLPLLSTGLLATLLLGGMVWAYLKPQPLAQACYFTAAVLVVFFFYFRFGGKPWHSDLFFVNFIGFVWFCRSRKLRLGRDWIFIFLLALNALGGVKTVVGTNLRPLAGSAMAAEWIQERGLEKEFLIGYPCFPTIAVAGYLERPLYYVELEDEGAYAAWGRHQIVEANQLYLFVERVFEKRELKKVYLIYDFGLEHGTRGGWAKKLDPSIKVTELARLEQCIRENYIIYLLEKTEIAPGPHRRLELPLPLD